MKELTIWITYHDDRQVENYSLRNDETFKLVKGNDVNVTGKNINYLNPFYSELTTLYWVWANNIRSNIVGFCHYRRIFTNIMEIELGSCQVMQISYFESTILQHYKSAHNYSDLYDIIDILNEIYGKDNKYSEYLLNGKVFVPFCCFVMRYEDFEHLCNFLFPILFKYDEKNRLNMLPDRYRLKAEKDFRYDNIDYQQRAISFLAERLISSYIVNNMKINCLRTYNNYL